MPHIAFPPFVIVCYVRERRSYEVMRERGYLHPHAGAAGPAMEEALAFAPGEEAFEDL